MKILLILCFIFSQLNVFASDCSKELSKKIPKLAREIASKKRVLKLNELPAKGRVRFIPPKKWTPGQELKKGPSGGFIDRFGNEWKKGPSRTKGHRIEWDVQLSSTGKAQLGWASKNGKYINVSMDGRITH